MLGNSLRFCAQVKCLNGFLAFYNSTVLQTVLNYKQSLITRNYAKDCKECCKDVDPTRGKRVEPWPKPETGNVPWRPECSMDPQPPYYDPYRIKVPDVVVPPLPATNAKPMIQCRGSPCSPKKAPPPPPCPTPPPKPFNWLYIILVGIVMTSVGLLYKWWLWRDEIERSGVNKPIWRPGKAIKRPSNERDLPACVQYLIIGSGAAGWAGYLAIREHDKKAKVFILTKDDALPYIQPPMTKHMWWNSDPPNRKTLQYVQDMKRKTMYLAECKHFMDPVKFYRKKTGPAVSIATGWCVKRIDADDHVVYVDGICGEAAIYYERCLFAPGSKPRSLTALKTAPKKVRDMTISIHTLRDLEVAYRKVRKAKHVTVIGGGVLGTEVAYYMGRMHKEFYPPLEGDDARNYVKPHIAHVFKNKGILSSFIPEYLGEWAAEKLRCESVQMIPNAEVYDAFESEDGRLELTLSNGDHLVTDFAIVAVGCVARDDIAKNSFLETDPVNGGYLVNTELEARKHLYIAGDAASFYSQWKDTRLRVEHYETAEEQGYIAGANMTGYWIPCNMEPEFWVKLEQDLQVEAVGEVGACMSTIGLFKPCDPPDPIQAKYENLIGETARPCYKDTQERKNRYRRGMVFYLRDEIVVGIVFWNVPPIEDRKAVATELLRARVKYEEIGLLAELLGFKELECVYVPNELKKDPPGEPLCIKNSKWLDPFYMKIAGKTITEYDPSKKRMVLTADPEEEAVPEEVPLAACSEK